jgi:membrane protein implicated in regulation of membrane protease activity
MATPHWDRRSSSTSVQRTAVIVTAAALITVNLVVAYMLARASGMRGIELPAMVVWLLVIGSLAITVAAVILWRRYMRLSRPPNGAR